MKICFYNVTASCRSGGLETYCWEVGHALAERGHEVHIMAGEGGSRRRENVVLIQFPFRDRNLFPNLGTRFRKLMERLSFGINAGYFLSKNSYDAIVINKPFDFPVLWWLKKRGLKAKVVFRSGGTDFFPGDGFFAAAVDYWVSSSKYNARQIEKRYGRSVAVIHNGVDTRLFSPMPKQLELKRKFGIPEKALVLMSTGRLIGLKGLQTIVDILPALEHIHFIIVGEGPMRPVLEDLAGNLGVSSRVHFSGAIAHKELPYVLNQADIFVQPSIGEEAFGISVVEAMACGLPVLASNNGGIPEVVTDNVTGLLLPAGDIASWQGAVERLSKAPELREKMGMLSRERAVRYFPWLSNAEKLEKLINMENG